MDSNVSFWLKRQFSKCLEWPQIDLGQMNMKESYICISCPTPLLSTMSRCRDIQHFMCEGPWVVSTTGTVSLVYIYKHETTTRWRWGWAYAVYYVKTSCSTLRCRYFGSYVDTSFTSLLRYRFYGTKLKNPFSFKLTLKNTGAYTLAAVVNINTHNTIIAYHNYYIRTVMYWFKNTKAYFCHFNL